MMMILMMTENENVRTGREWKVYSVAEARLCVLWTLICRQAYVPQRPRVKDKSNVCGNIAEHLSTETGTRYVHKYGSLDSRNTTTLRKFRPGKVATLLKYKLGWLDSLAPIRSRNMLG